MKKYPAILLRHRHAAASLLALAGIVAAATGGWGLLHHLVDHHAAAVAQAVAPALSPPPCDPPSPEDGCGTCEIAISLVRVGIVDTQPQGLPRATCSGRSVPAVTHRPASSIHLNRGARAPPHA